MESHTRSVLKGLSWRITGTLDTMVIAFLITGHLSAAFKIGGIEVVTKILLYYLHERIWMKINWGISNADNKARHRRSFVKGISWRATGTIDTIVISFFVTGILQAAIKIGSIEVITKVFLYYLHERIWERIQFGKKQITKLKNDVTN